jgi:hypothetical protein
LDKDGLIFALGKGNEGSIRFVLNEGGENRDYVNIHPTIRFIWHPEGLSKHPYLRQMDYERKKQIELAYGKLVGE